MTYDTLGQISVAEYETDGNDIMIRTSKDEHLRWICVYYVGIIFILDINFLLTFTLFFNDILCPIN